MKIRELYERIRKRVYECSADRVKSHVIPDGIEQAVCVDVTNVAQWAHNQFNLTKKYLSICPTRLPFPAMWFEYPILVQDMNSENRHSGMMGVLAQENGVGENFANVITFSIFLYDSTDDWCCLTSMGAFNVNTKELLPFPQYTGPSFDNGLTAREVTEQNFERSMNIIVPVLVFFNCKNIELRKLERSKKAIKAANRKHIKAPEFYVIEIHKQTVRNVYEGGVSGNGVIRHASLVRGHFKTYTEENKLFGQKTGTWFWESHVRGDIGVPTVRDYRVHEPHHKGECTSL